jgi:hypothetical protein
MRYPSIQNNQSVVWARMFLFFPMVIFAVITFLTHASRILDLRFDLYAISAGFATIISIFIWILIAKEEIKQIEIKDKNVVVALLLLCFLGMVLASIYHKPNIDDPSYVPNAVHYLTFPTDKMGNEIHFIYSSGKPILSVVALTSGPFEYAQSLFAFLFRLEYLTVYHILTVAFVGFTIPLTLYLLLSHYATDSVNAVIATFIFILFLLLFGDTIYSIGSFSFTRIFQGKVVLIAAGIPLFSALSLDYLSNPSLRRWSYLLIAATAFSGLSSTSFFMLPMLALSLGLAFVLSHPLRWQSLLDYISYGSALIYLLTYGLYASLSTVGYRESANPLSWRYPGDFMGSLQLFINPRFPLTPLATVISIILVVLIVKSSTRKFLLLWVTAIIILYTNPIVTPYWMKYVTSHYIYWRVFLLLPISSLLGSVLISILEQFTDTSPYRKGLFVGLVTLLLITFNFIPGFPSIYQRGGGTIDFPREKVDEKDLTIARLIADQAPQGAMLAPPSIAGVTTMVEGGHPQLHLGKPFPLFDLMSLEEAESRAWASFFTEGNEQHDETFRSVVDRYPEIVVIVINKRVISEVETFITSRGFIAQETIEDYTIYWKQ